MGFLTRLWRALQFLFSWRGPVKVIVELLVNVAEKSGQSGGTKKAIVKNAIREMLPRLVSRFGLPKAMGEPAALAWVDKTVDEVVDHFNREGWPGR